MSDVAQTALDFCRECEGWPDAKKYTNGEVERSFTPPRGFNDFQYCDLNTVMEAVRKWCDSAHYQMEIKSIHGAGGRRWLVRILHEGDALGFQARDQLTEALLAACIDAHRKLKPA